MTLRSETPCDFGPCPYDAEYSRDCDWWCSAEEPEDNDDLDFYIERIDDDERI